MAVIRAPGPWPLPRRDGAARQEDTIIISSCDDAPARTNRRVSSPSPTSVSREPFVTFRGIIVSDLSFVLHALAQGALDAGPDSRGEEGFGTRVIRDQKKAPDCKIQTSFYKGPRVKGVFFICC
jgi:hypothetical protein